MHRVHTRTAAAVILISICLVGTGCTTTRTLPRPHAAAEAKSAGLKPGDKVVVMLNSGAVETFRITAIEPDALVGKDERIPFADIEKLQRKNVSVLKTAGVVVGALAVAYAVLVQVIIEGQRGSD